MKAPITPATSKNRSVSLVSAQLVLWDTGRGLEGVVTSLDTTSVLHGVGMPPVTSVLQGLTASLDTRSEWKGVVTSPETLVLSSLDASLCMASFLATLFAIELDV